MRLLITLIFMLFFFFGNCQEKLNASEFIDNLNQLSSQGKYDDLQLLVRKTLDTAKNSKFIIRVNDVNSITLLRQNRMEEFNKCVEETGKLALKNGFKDDYVRFKLFKVDYFNYRGEFNKSLEIVDDLNKIIYRDKYNNAQKIELNLANITVGIYSSLRDTLKQQESSLKLYKLLNNIDTLNSDNYSTISRSAINYADYLDTYNRKDEAYFWYKKSNNYAHLIKNNYFINFSRLRLAGSLNIKDRSLDALDSLRAIQKDKSLDLNMRFLLYDGLISTFTALNLKDSILVYQSLKDEISTLSEEDFNSQNNDEVIETNKNKFGDFDLFIIVSILVFIIGLGIFIFVFYKSRK